MSVLIVIAMTSHVRWRTHLVPQNLKTCNGQRYDALIVIFMLLYGMSMVQAVLPAKPSLGAG